jgi:hypothetical protein
MLRHICLQSTIDRNAGTQSQLSMNSSASSQQSRLGILGQASKFVSSVLAGRKVNPQVKSLQLAAAAAKKVGSTLCSSLMTRAYALSHSNKKRQTRRLRG